MCLAVSSESVEVRRSLKAPDIERLIPSDYRIQVVSHCRSSLRLMPDIWLRDSLSPKDSRDAHAIEVLNASGRVMAAVGWISPVGSDKAHTTGTFVSRCLRRRGLGKALWRTMIETLKRTGYSGVIGEAVSDEGFTLLVAMKNEFPEFVEFKGNEYEDLRKNP